MIDWQLKSRGVPLFTFGETLHPALTINSAASKAAVNDASYLSSNLLCYSIHQRIPAASIPMYVDHIREVLGDP